MAQIDYSSGTLAAYFENSSDARKAVDALKKAGFTSAHLGIAHHGSYTGESSTVGNSTVFETEDKDASETSTWEKIKAWFSGNEAEARKEERAPGDAATLVPPAQRFDDGYDDTSDLQGSFTAMNIPDERARYFAHRFGNGKDAAVVTVQAEDRTAEAESILAQYNADFGEGTASYGYPAAANAGDELRPETARDGRNVQLLGVMRVRSVRIMSEDPALEDPRLEDQALENQPLENQPLGRKVPARDLRSGYEDESISNPEKSDSERSA